MSEWKPIETAPKDGTPVLLVWHWDSGLHTGIGVVLAAWGCQTHRYSAHHFGCPNEPDCKMNWDAYGGKMTHWMELPPLPLH